MDFSNHTQGTNLTRTNGNIPANAFTKELQESLISDFFGSTNNTYNNYRPQQPSQPIQQAPANDTNASVNNSLLERANLLEAENARLKATLSANYAQPSQPTQVQNAQGQPVAPNAVPSQNESTASTFNSFMDELLGTVAKNDQQPQTSQPQQPAQVQPTQPIQQEQQVDTNAAMLEFNKYSSKYGYTAKEAIEFANSLTAEDFVELYHVYKNAANNQSNKQTTQPIVNVSDMPKVTVNESYRPVASNRHPLFG